MFRFFEELNNPVDICEMKLTFSTLLRSYKWLFLLIGTAFFQCVALAQNTIQLEMKWGAPKQLESFGETATVPNLLGGELDGGRPVFFYKEKSDVKMASVELVNYNFSPIPTEDFNYLKNFGFLPEEKLQLEAKVTNDRKESFLVIHLFPYIKKGEAYYRLNNIELKIVPTNQSIITTKDFAANSVLQNGSGSWYKIGVKNDGVYKIDKALLQSWGISTEDLNPQHINIYGNGDGKLPELNSAKRTDDLAKNAIYVIGESDGTFDTGDYILFYGWGPNRWYPNGLTEFDQDKNIYSDYSYYFLNINPSEVPLRISTIPNSINPITNTVTSYSYRDIYENDLVNLVKGGQRWYGELFDTELERTFTFQVPNITSDPVFFKTAMATNCRSSAGTLQEYSVNGSVLSTSTLPSVSADYIQTTKNMILNSPPSTIPFKIKVVRTSPSTLTYLDRIVLNARRNLFFTGQQLNFRDFVSVGTGKSSVFQISNFPNQGFVWDVTDRHTPKLISGTLVGNVLSFQQDTDTLREFVVSNGTNFLTPEFVGNISYQNLHGLPQADYLIITHKNFKAQAERLADLHRTTGMTVHVVNTEQIFNEFSSGMLDPTAIRMFAKMFYDRGALTPSTRPKHLLLFGDGTYDPKNRISGNNNYVPTYQMVNGENHISALVTDDYYGMMDNNESITAADMVDINIGRLLISDNTMAKQQVDKIEHYMKNGSSLFASAGNSEACNTNGYTSTFGDWRLNYVQIADDEESGYFIVQDTEPQYVQVKSEHPEMNCDKLYTDAFTQVSTAGGHRYPDVFDAISNRVDRGALIINYVGHGGEVGLAEERIVTVPQIQSWKNINKLNVFVSATCEFTKYDDPSRVSAGEWASLNPTGGSIALMTTTRSVFFGVNTITGKRFFENVFDRDANNEPLTFGEIMRLTKNASGSSDNKRSFTLIGDPALKIALPRMKIVTDSVNGVSPSVQMDTIRALSRVTIKGHVEDMAGNPLTSFNGIVSPKIFDKIKIQNTLGQDPGSPVIPFEIQRNIVYKGKATVKNGAFEFSFIVPKDISYAFDKGKISYYAENGSTDAGGSDDRIIIGGIDTVGLNDNEGPTIDLYLNDELFVSGGITNETPVLIANLFDESGINTVGNGIGHDLVAIIDANTANPIVLNEYYTADVDSYQSGSLRYTLPKLSQGEHTLTLKVWDVNNNSSETTVRFIVQENENLNLAHVLNYPNPFTTKTSFFFEHNQACSQLDVQIQIMTVSGKLVRTINKSVHTEGFRSEGIDWDGKDDFGDQLAKGVYVYLLKVKTDTGKIAEKIEKLVLLK